MKRMRFATLLLCSLAMAGCASHFTVKEIKGDLEQAQTRLTRLEEQNNVLAGSSRDSFSGMRAATIELNTRTETIQREMQLVRSDFAKLQASMDEMMARMRGELADSRALGDRLRPLLGTIENYQRDYDATNRTLADLQTEYARQLRDLRVRLDEIEAKLAADGE